MFRAGLQRRPCLSTGDRYEAGSSLEMAWHCAVMVGILDSRIYETLERNIINPLLVGL